MKTFKPQGLSAALVIGLALAFCGNPASAADRASDGDEELQSRTGKQIKLRGFDAQASMNEQMLVLAEQKRMESIDRLKGLLTKGVRDDTKAEMMLRLADLYFQQGRYLYLREMASFDKTFDTCFNTPQCDTEQLKPDNSGSREWQEKSIKLYDGILRNYPRYERSDQATFYLGSAFKDLGREQEAAEAFKQLVKLYPQSDFIADAWVQIGEYYFDVESNAFGALKAYLNATRYTDSPKYAYSLYKLGWCYYNVGEYENSIATMKKVVDHSMANADQTQANLQLQDEALKDLVRFFADADQMNEAIEYFTKLGRTDLIRTTLKRLAAMFFEQGKFDRAIEMYRRLILDDPTAKDNPEYQAEIISAYKKTGQREKVLDEINRLRTEYGPNSPWSKANASDPQAVADAQSKIEAQLRGIALDYHNTARQYEKSRHPETMQVYTLAKTAYQTYLEIFPNNEHTYEVRFAYGELLYRLKDFAGAFDQYTAVVEIDPKGKHSKFCAESAIFAAEEQIKVEGGASGSGQVTVKATKDVQPQEMSPWEQKFVDACNRYATLYPEDKKVSGVIYKSAYMLYNKYRFEDASKQFQVVIAMDPGSKDAELAANLILDALSIKENWDSLRQTAKAFYDQKGLGSAAFKKDVHSIYMNSSFKLVEVNFEKDKDYGKAADGFLAFYEEFPEAAISAQALNNSAAYFSKAGRVADSVKVRHILIDDPKFGPKTKYYYDQIGFLGFDYEQIADYENAAFYYEKLWALTPTERAKPENSAKTEEMNGKSADAIYSAAVFRKGLGQWEKAIEDYNALVDAFPDDKRVPDIKIRVGRIYEENEKWQEAANVYQAFYKSPPKDAPLEFQYFARLHYGQAMEKLGKRKERDAIYADTVKTYAKYVEGGGQKGPQTEYVAEMMYELAQPKVDGYMKLAITGAGRGASQKAEDKAMKESLTRKTRSMVDVEKSLTDVVASGAGEWGLASLVGLGKVYENMANSFTNSERPSYLTSDQVEMYDMAMADKAYVLEEKAVNAYKLALEKSYELTLYNENTAYATRQLGELRPDDFPGLTEALLDPRYTSAKSGQKYSFETSL